jgi:outer membrane protein assembly factor BamB
MKAKPVTLRQCSVFITLIFFTFPSLFSQDISQWRGPDRNGIYRETGLMKKWPEGGPPLLWRYDDLGDGFSSAAVTSKRIYITGMIRGDGYLYALDHAGNLVWKKEYGEEWRGPYPGTRSTPNVFKGRVYLMSGKGVVVCFMAESGRIVWKNDLVKNFRGYTIRWGYNESLLIDGDNLICTPGGPEAGIVALNRLTGKTVWVSNCRGDRRAYSSPILVKLPSRRIIVTVMKHGFVGVDADTGKFLWSRRQTNETGQHSNSPLYKDGYIYSFSWDFGGVQVKLSLDGRKIKDVWHNRWLDSGTGGAVLVDGYIYGSGTESGRGWQCLDWKTGKRMYHSRELTRGNVIYADGMLYCYSERGRIALVKPNPQRFQVISKFRVPERFGYKITHPVIRNGRLYVRAGESLLVYSIKQ